MNKEYHPAQFFSLFSVKLAYIRHVLQPVRHISQIRAEFSHIHQGMIAADSEAGDFYNANQVKATGKQMMQAPYTLANITEEKSLANLNYALQAIGLLTIIPFLLSAFIYYSKRKEVEGTVQGSHFKWQIRTFWGACFLLALATLLLFTQNQILWLYLTMLWIAYRIARGIYNLNDYKKMYITPNK